MDWKNSSLFFRIRQCCSSGLEKLPFIPTVFLQRGFLLEINRRNSSPVVEKREIGQIVQEKIQFIYLCSDERTNAKGDGETVKLPFYKTIKGYGEAEIVIKRSQFIGYAKPAVSEEEAVAFIEEIKQRHKQATHNCSAYMVGERDQFQKASDDGEPSGTAGKPILEVIKHKQLKNVAVVVTRYFGGILLGAGGLVRAYTDGAVAGLEAAGIVYKVLHTPVRITMDYTWFGKVENELRNRGFMYGDVEYTDKVSVRCLPLAGESERFIAWMTDLTAGQTEITSEEPLYIDHDELPEGLG